MEIEKTASGLAAHNGREVLEVTVCGGSLVHAVARPEEAPVSKSPRPWMLDPAQFCPGDAFQIRHCGDLTTLTTSSRAVSPSVPSGNLAFKTDQGDLLIRKIANLPRTYDAGPMQPA
jgi:hypothetical protein